jgi:hypothetical protein
MDFNIEINGNKFNLNSFSRFGSETRPLTDMTSPQRCHYMHFMSIDC